MRKQQDASDRSSERRESLGGRVEGSGLNSGLFYLFNCYKISKYVKLFLILFNILSLTQNTIPGL